MSETRYKVGDVVLSYGEPIIPFNNGGYAGHFSNALCIIREVLETDELLDPEHPVYRCTLIATGEEVYLVGEEIVEVKD